MLSTRQRCSAGRCGRNTHAKAQWSAVAREATTPLSCARENHELREPLPARKRRGAPPSLPAALHRASGPRKRNPLAERLGARGVLRRFWTGTQCCVSRFVKKMRRRASRENGWKARWRVETSPRSLRESPSTNFYSVARLPWFQSSQMTVLTSLNRHRPCHDLILRYGPPTVAECPT